MIDVASMSAEDVAWLDAYHEQVSQPGVALWLCGLPPDPSHMFPQVWTAVSPRLQDRPRALEWLATNTRPLAVQQRAP